MENNTKRLELETILNQIQNNDNRYDGPFRSFSFNRLNFILINNVYCYLSYAKIEFQMEYLCIIGEKIHFDIRYGNIDTFLINFKERANVH